MLGRTLLLAACLALVAGPLRATLRSATIDSSMPPCCCCELPTACACGCDRPPPIPATPAHDDQAAPLAACHCGPGDPAAPPVEPRACPTARMGDVAPQAAVSIARVDPRVLHPLKPRASAIAPLPRAAPLILRI